MSRLSGNVNGGISVTQGSNYLSSGRLIGNLKTRKSAPESVSGAIKNHSLIHMVSAALNINAALVKISNNFNVKELPARAAVCAHWSGPLVAAR